MGVFTYRPWLDTGVCVGFKWVSDGRGISQTSFPSLHSITNSFPRVAMTVTRHSFLPSSKISLILFATSLRCSSSGKLTSDLTSPSEVKSSRVVSSRFNKVYSVLLTIGAGDINKMVTPIKKKLINR